MNPSSTSFLLFLLALALDGGKFHFVFYGKPDSLMPPFSVIGLQCLVGLGNTSQKKNLRVVDCPEHERYVCLKMFGGGMGDQIRRKCEKLEAEVSYDTLTLDPIPQIFFDEFGSRIVDPRIVDPRMVDPRMVDPKES